jgi:uncharacterized protein YqhQ
MSQPVPYGGQAVLEGVMIRGPRGMSVACRRPNGTIIVRTRSLSRAHTGAPRRVPLVRGVVTLWETLSLGTRALFFSSQIARAEDGESGDVELPEQVFWGSIAAAIVFAAGLFFASPLLLAQLLDRLGAGHVTITAVEGAIRIGLFVGYVALIGRAPGIRRVFQYHGAEHMAVHAYEAGAPLTVDRVRRFPKEHTRCGTSFLLIVMLVTLAASFAVDLLLDQGIALRAVSRVALMPVVAALSYELLRLGAGMRGNPLVRLLFLPNIGLQALTTRVPDDAQIEVAIASMEAILAHAVALPDLTPSVLPIAGSEAAG